MSLWETQADSFPGIFYNRKTPHAFSAEAFWPSHFKDRITCSNIYSNIFFNSSIKVLTSLNSL